MAFITLALLLRMLGVSDTKTIQITSTSYEYSILGLEDDFFVGDSDRDWIETGGGSDEVYAGAGDDVVKVQGKQQDTVEFKVTVGNRQWCRGLCD